jgi:hypothetical protein
MKKRCEDEKSGSAFRLDAANEVTLAVGAAPGFRFRVEVATLDVRDGFCILRKKLASFYAY